MRKILIPTLLVLFGFQAQAVEVAITIDDLPHIDENVKLPEQKWQDISEQMLQSFAKHKLKNIYGFVIGRELKENPELTSVLDRWVQMGQRLGNHTYSHLSFSLTPVADYEKNFLENDQLLQKWPNHIKFFRYPHLQEGNDAEKRNQFRSFLTEQNYRVAQVTVDFSDWKLNMKYVAAMKAGDAAQVEFLKKEMVRKAVGHLKEAQETAKEYFGRDIKHVVLMHMTPLTAMMMDDVLAAYEKMGAEFVSLEDAESDPVYNYNPDVYFTSGLTLLEQEQLRREQLNKPPAPERKHR